MRQALATVILALLALLTTPLVVRAQRAIPVFRIGFLVSDTPASTICGPRPTNMAFKTFQEGLHALGYVEGRNIVLECRTAEGNYDRLATLVSELVQLRPDVIVAGAAPASLAAKRATSTIPIVSVYTADPVGLGLVASLARPGGNVTGLSALASDYVAKSLQLLKELLPSASRLAIVGHEPNPTYAIYRRELDGAARSLGVALHLVGVRTPPDLDDAFSAIARRRFDGVLVMHQPFTFVHRQRIVDLATARRLPAMHGSREATEAGGLMSYSASVSDTWRRAATFVDKILKGARPADLPVEQPTTFELVINLKTAKALGLTIPPTLLLRADQVLE